MVNFSFSKEIKNPELPLTHEQKNIIREYCSLASLSSLSESEAQRIADILEIAQIDQILDFWMTEADYVIGHNLNLIHENEQKNFQARLREYLVTDCGGLKQITFRHTK
ncbi:MULTISPECIES: hypothetical protein [unclassified Nostoc]|jgi:hypothetical protein|uniref:hypothetical protein n=1 Tax=unclassified Nostoc TaxID=2593658 RepID=UPI000DECC533|nr:MULTISPECIES: hypothetical protein [unclassified Nostoc]QHG20944.1 hypothetical protein GJB62_34245 [Nostoc sp. ATCC 53789]QLE53679.1 hypothetical protein FD724_38130 [Nostoc sp. C057]RCJ21180.1 hypothetical protein A6V25_25595 [Nostoc sp. ATCC 53789]